MAELRKLRRQFISYTKLHPTENIGHISNIGTAVPKILSQWLKKGAKLLLGIWWCMSWAGAPPSSPQGTRRFSAHGRSYPMWSSTDNQMLNTVTHHVVSG
ncbi:hypothetical protein CRUP_030497 [Coryphaenoides rupestris]|nr:hypothetical protein CRUP_030497 [Coryphaenoides rupestris]